MESFIAYLRRMFGVNPTVPAKDWGSEFGYAPATQAELDAWNAAVQRRNTWAKYTRPDKRETRQARRAVVRAGYGAR